MSHPGTPVASPARVPGLFFLALGIILTVVSGSALGWYPSRLGGLSDWLDDRLYAPALGVLTNGPTWLTTAGTAYLLALLLSFGGYFFAARWAARLRAGTRRHLGIIWGIQVALCLWLWVQPYFSSQDVFSYAFYTHIYVLYHANPYVAVPRDYPFDPLFSAIFWKDQPSNYGPLWTYLSSLAPLLVGTQIGPSLLILKAIVIFPTLASTPLLWSALSQWRPEQRVVGTLLYALNPLLLIETAEAGHNDPLMAVMLVGSIWCWSRQRRTLGIAALVVAALVKYVAIVLVPLYLIDWWRRDRESPLRILTKVTIVGVGLVVAAFGPLYAGWATFGVIGFGANALAYTNSPMEVVFRQVRIALGDSVQLADLPLHYEGYWIGTHPNAILWSIPDEQKASGIALPASTPLLVVEPPAESWMHVYEPRLGRFGYVRENLVSPIPAPVTAVSSGATSAVLAGVSNDPATERANIIIRILSILIFFVWFCRCAWRVYRSDNLFHACTELLVIYLMVVQTWFWPWYLIWVVPFAALVPESTYARILFIFTMTTSALNAQPRVTLPPFLDWLYLSRMMLIYGIPLTGVVIWQLLTQLARARASGYQLGWIDRCWTWFEEFGSLTIARAHLLVDRLIVQAVQFLVACRRWRPTLRQVIGVGLAVTVVVSGSVSVHGMSTKRQPAVIEWQRAFNDAQRHYAAGEYQAAVNELGDVLAARPDEPSVLRLRIAANLQLGHYPQTIPDLSRLLEQDPYDVSLLLERGAMYARIQRYDRALADFQRVLGLAPFDPSGYERIGVVEYEEGEFAQARRDLSTALAMAPDDGQIALELADVYASQGVPRQALPLYDRSIHLDPTSARTYAARAAVLRELGQTDATIPDLQKVLVLTGDVQEEHWAERLLDRLTASAKRVSDPRD